MLLDRLVPLQLLHWIDLGRNWSLPPWKEGTSWESQRTFWVTEDSERWQEEWGG